MNFYNKGENMKKYLLLLLVLFVGSSFASTTNVRIYMQAQTSLNSLQNKQIGVQNVADANLGYRMWGGKDTGGIVSYWLAKSKPALVTSMRQDSSFSIKDTSKLYKGDSAFISGHKASRLYYGIVRGDTSFNIYDTAKIMKADSGNFGKLRYGSLSGTRISADTINAVKILNLSKVGTHYSGDGDIYYDSTHRSLECATNGMWGTINRCAFTQSNIKLDSNSTDTICIKGDDSLLLSENPPLLDSLSANFFRKGKTLRFYISGTYTTKNVTPGNIEMWIKFNNTTICSTGVQALDQNQTAQNWDMNGSFICRDTGTTGKIFGETSWDHIVSGVKHADPMITPPTGTTINTKIPQRFKLCVKFSTADVANKIRTYQFSYDEVH